MPKLKVYKGGAGSGHHGHAGIPGHRGGSLPGISTGELTDALVALSSNYSDPQTTEILLQGVAESLGLQTSVIISDDAKFNSNVATAAKAAGANPNSVAAYYRLKTDEVHFRTSSISSITDKNSQREFRLKAFHELGHAYDAQIRNTTLRGVKSAAEYNASTSEHYANSFAARMDMVYRYVNGSTTGLATRPLTKHISGGGDITTFLEATQ